MTEEEEAAVEGEIGEFEAESDGGAVRELRNKLSAKAEVEKSGIEVEGYEVES